MFYVLTYRENRIDCAWSLNESYAINYYQLLCSRYPNQDGRQYPFCDIRMYDRIHNPYPELNKILDCGREIIKYTSKHDKSYSIFLPAFEYGRFRARCIKMNNLRDRVFDAFMMLCGARLEFFHDNYFKDSLRKMQDRDNSNIIPSTYEKYKTNFDFIKWFVRTDMKYLDDVGDLGHHAIGSNNLIL